MPGEPAHGAVIAYQVVGRDDARLDYVSLRAGDGLWYTTGKNPMQGVTWERLWAAIRENARGPVMIAWGWDTLYSREATR